MKLTHEDSIQVINAIYEERGYDDPTYQRWKNHSSNSLQSAQFLFNEKDPVFLTYLIALRLTSK